MHFEIDFLQLTLEFASVLIFFKTIKFIAWLGKKKHQKRIARGNKYIVARIKPFEPLLDKVFLYGCIVLSVFFILYGVTAAGLTYTKHQNLFIAMVPIVLTSIAATIFLIRSLQLYKAVKI